jgi:redox-sensitive bicupin YhaK (pirin superfamily)
LPARAKFCEPGYKMYWAETMQHAQGEGGASCEVSAGVLGSPPLAAASAAPPPHSWAADEANDVGVFLCTLPPGSRFELPPARGGAGVNRMAYVVEGATGGPAGDCGVRVGGEPVPARGGFGGRAAFALRGELPCLLENRHASEEAQVLVLQGRPIGEPVAQRGPFVSTYAERTEPAHPPTLPRISNPRQTPLCPSPLAAPPQ